MTFLKKYNKPEIEVVLIENDIITNSGMGGAGTGRPDIGSGGDPLESSARQMGPYSRPLGIFKRD